MTDYLHSLTRITDFRKLRTGHKKKEVVVITEKGRIFVARVLHNNFYTCRTVQFDNGKIFNIPSETIDGEKVHLFFPSEKLADEYAKQSERDKIDEYMKSAASQDVFAL